MPCHMPVAATLLPILLITLRHTLRQARVAADYVCHRVESLHAAAAMMWSDTLSCMLRYCLR